MLCVTVGIQPFLTNGQVRVMNDYYSMVSTLLGGMKESFSISFGCQLILILTNSNWFCLLI